MVINLCYFSGTGSTEYVAKEISRQFSFGGHEVIENNLRFNNYRNEGDILVLCFVVHACNAPEPVMNWAKSLPDSDKKPVVIISVSGGGEVTPNLACRLPLKKIFTKKKYNIVHEEMIVMPSNWIVPTKPVLVYKLLEVLPIKISKIVNDVINQKIRLTNPPLGNRILTFLGQLEHVGAHYFGKKIKVLPSCNSCGLCKNGCPVNNITIENGLPTFSNKCILCLNCIYSCPRKSLAPQMAKFVVIKTGYNFNKLLKKSPPQIEVDIDREAKGLLWLGVKRYLLDT